MTHELHTRHQTKMHTQTQHAPHTNRDRLWATKRNSHTNIQTIHPFGFGVRQSCLGSKPYNNPPQHPSNYTEQRSTHHHWLHTNYTNKSPTLRNTDTHTTRPHKHAWDTILSSSQCKPRSPMPLHAGPPTYPT